MEMVIPVHDNGNGGHHSVSSGTLVADGAYLTWKDLWVTVSTGYEKNSNKPILQGLTGIAMPGELLAIMGPSGCGKSTLLDALGGRLSLKMRQTGEILINGRKKTLAYGTSAYVTQNENLLTTLTVSEAVYYSAQLQLPDSMSISEKKERAEMTIKEMGLQDAMSTRIAGYGDKGLSGGEKQRVSICIEILTRPKLLFLDEPTSGLDSAASYYVMIYFGMACLANEFFSSSGFPCPTLQNPCDHFLKTINKDLKSLHRRSNQSLIKSYKASKICQRVRRQVAKISQQEYCGALENNKSHASFLTQCIVLTKRSFINMHRDPGYYWLRLAIYLILAIGLGTIYYNIGLTYESIQERRSLLTFVASFLTFMSIGGFPSFVEEMKVFERERLNGHYGAAAFVMGNTFSAIPYLLIISIIPGALSYYLPGLRKGCEPFFYFTCVLFACMMLVESLMMIIASVVPNFLMGIITGAGVQGLMILSGGFFQLPKDLPDIFWRYPLYYISFHKYAYQGLFKNEFKGLVLSNNGLAGGPANITGEDVLMNMWEIEKNYSKWTDLSILFGMLIVYRILFLLIIKINEKRMPINIAFMSIGS
ncbi:hypothetical protein FNV43_RR22121 [Rhamnella rubrinervis]|uniref:ABC transporter domain-containing protein n=1 Tax=Rhamnella rubrinervis TaxID=2594499 RepID=A0A8K0DVY5_9ROSA|nr:hypothetical protein FNV43_RR22121 [Rhamnella rubrinervis]